MNSTTVSEAALCLLRRRLSGERVGITDQNRPLHRELVEAGAMIPINTFLGGPEGFYRLTLDAPLVASGDSPSSPTPSPAEALAPGG